MPRTRQAKDALFDAFASVAKAMASGRRAEIIDVLAQGERSVEDIAHEIDQSVANTSHHLRLLARSGLLRARRDGTHVLYRLASPRVAELWTALRDVAATHVAEVGVLAADLVGDRRDVEALSPDELARRIDAGTVVVLDVRPHLEYEAGHIAGARSVPVDELPGAVAGLPRSREIVAYCRGPYCVKADDAVRILHDHGLRARRLDIGYPEWRNAGLPVETPDPPPD